MDRRRRILSGPRRRRVRCLSSLESHAAALRFTAQRTREITGLDWGGGLYINYLFTLLWLADLAAWWRLGPDYPRRHRRIYRLVQAIFAFMAFNATVIFGPALWRGVAAVFALLLATAWLRRASR